MNDAVDRKKSEKMRRIEEEKQANDKINKEVEQERLKVRSDKSKKMNEKWGEYQDYISKKDAGKKPKPKKEEPVVNENIVDLMKKVPQIEEKKADVNEQGMTEEEYERLYQHYLDLQKKEKGETKEKEKEIIPVSVSNTQNPQKSFQDPILYNASDRIAELNKHNKYLAKKQGVEKIAVVKHEKNNHFDNKNLDDFNKKVFYPAEQPNKENVSINKLDKVEKCDVVEKKKQYKQILDDQIKENQKLKDNSDKDSLKPSKKKKDESNVVIQASALSHNPIVNPVNSYDYNKYLQGHKI